MNEPINICLKQKVNITKKMPLARLNPLSSPLSPLHRSLSTRSKGKGQITAGSSPLTPQKAASPRKVEKVNIIEASLSPSSQSKGKEPLNSPTPQKLQDRSCATCCRLNKSYIITVLVFGVIIGVIASLSIFLNPKKELSAQQSLWCSQFQSLSTQEEIVTVDGELAADPNSEFTKYFVLLNPSKEKIPIKSENVTKDDYWDSMRGLNVTAFGRRMECELNIEDSNLLRLKFDGGVSHYYFHIVI
jgi:hypothetical protein